MPEEAIRELRRRLRIFGVSGPLQSTPDRSGFGCPAEVPTAEVLAAAPGAAAPLEPTLGRRHFLLRGTGLAEEGLGPLLAPLMPLIYRYFAENRHDAPPGSMLDSPSATCTAPTPRLFLSECQLLVSDPGAEAQMWHRDNRQPGLTVILPLTDVDAEVGPTDLLPGTHRLVGGGASGLLAAFSSLRGSSGAIAAAPLAPGDALLYDARLLHRGLGNTSYGRCRAVLVLRLDHDDTPPPGSSVPQTFAARVLGRFLQGLGALYSALPAPSRRAT